MNRFAATACIVAGAFAIISANAQVPSLINYQGRLTTVEGTPMTGTKNFAIAVYDAATGGNLLYTESIGSVEVDANGVYSFQFGSSGTSNTQVTETLAITNGSSTSFQKVLGKSPVVTGSVTVTDGKYLWNQSTGSTNEDDFGVAYSASLRRVTVSYYADAPTTGTPITATYRYGTSGISGALSSGAEHWMAVSVDDSPYGSRQRVLAVPFATHARYASEIGTPEQTRSFFLPMKSYSTSSDSTYLHIPSYINEIHNIQTWASLGMRQYHDREYKTEKARLLIYRYNMIDSGFFNTYVPISGLDTSFRFSYDNGELVYSSEVYDAEGPLTEGQRLLNAENYAIVSKPNLPIIFDHSKYFYVICLQKDFVEPSGSTQGSYRNLMAPFLLTGR